MKGLPVTNLQLRAAPKKPPASTHIFQRIEHRNQAVLWCESLQAKIEFHHLKPAARHRFGRS